MVRNALLTRRRRRLLPLLTKEASGPYFTTKVDKDGIILPDVSYSSKLDPVVQTGDSGDTNNTQTHKSKIFLLNPLELMNIPIMNSEDKKIIDVEDQSGQREQRREPEDSESAMTVSCVGGVEPLAAPYQAGRLVSQVRTFTIIFLTKLFFFLSGVAGETPAAAAVQVQPDRQAGPSSRVRQPQHLGLVHVAV